MLAKVGPTESPTVVFSKMRGVFPADLIHYDAGRRLAFGNPENQTVSLYDPHLHPLHYEWYFTQGTATEIGREFVSKQDLTICLGVPTIASLAIKNDRDVIFIDQNAHVLARFPELLGASEIHLMDAREAGRLSIKAKSVIFDSPWYLGDSLAWLVTASHLVEASGTISFGLYPPLVRPTAQLERDFILQVASAIGRVDITEDALAYRTPLFEWEALKTCGIREVGDWRRGDLVVVRECGPLDMTFPAAPRRTDVDGVWKTFVIGSQVVKLRTNLGQDTNLPKYGLLSEVEGSFILPSVSVRDRRREAVHVWTSYNRVASSADASVLLQIFQKLESGIRLSDAVLPYKDRFGTEIEDQMRTFLLLET